MIATVTASTATGRAAGSLFGLAYGDATPTTESPEYLVIARR